MTITTITALVIVSVCQVRHRLSQKLVRLPV